MTFGEIVRNARKMRGWSQRRLSEEMRKIGASIDFTYVSRIENDVPEYPLSEEKIRKLAGLLELDPEELLFEAGKIPEEYKEIAKREPAKVKALFRKIKKELSTK